MTAQTSSLKQCGRIVISGILEARTGLHIGGTEVGLQIGGADSSVIRNGLDGLPYIPGSSLKGKMRSLLERVYAPGVLPPKENSKVARIYKPENLAQYDNADTGFVYHIFGTTPEAIDKLGGEALPTRLIVRDAPMKKETRDALDRSLYTDMPYTQVKTEVVIDRITSAATPRQIERVPAGAQFNFEMVFNLYFDYDVKFLDRITEAMELLEHDCLGGQGSRGYGQVRFIKRGAKVKWFNGQNFDTEVNAWKKTFERNETEGDAS